MQLLCLALWFFVSKCNLCFDTIASRKLSMDAFLTAADNALRTLFAQPRASEQTPAHGVPEASLDLAQKKLAGALMRVNHVGEVCAQALYSAQAAVTRDPALRDHLQAAAREETDHLAWTQQRLDALGARPSLLNPCGSQAPSRSDWLPPRSVTGPTWGLWWKQKPRWPRICKATSTGFPNRIRRQGPWSPE